MKKVTVIIFLLLSNINHSQNIISKEQKIESFIHIWGLLKYKHPTISNGTIDLDKEFIKKYETLKDINARKELNKSLIDWITGFNKGKLKKEPNTNMFTKNEDYSWVNNFFFNKELIQLLSGLKENSNFGNYYAKINKLSSTIDFKNDASLPNFNINNEAHKILFLASFWNKMRYWNVNIYLTDIKWNSVLQLMIPKFLKEDKVNFSKAKDELFSHINDSHSDYKSSLIFDTNTVNFSNYGGRIVNDTLVITYVGNKEIAIKDNIGIGDLIVSINNNKLNKYYNQKFSKSISASNKNFLKYRIERFFLLSDPKDSIQIGFVKKNGKKFRKFINLEPLSQKIRKPEYLYDSLISKKWIKLMSDIGYINLRTTDKNDLKSAFKSFKKTKGIIIDLRNYPRNLKATDIPNFIYPKKKTFLKVLTSSNPSLGKYDTQVALKMIKNPFVAGKSNKSFYKGKIVLLVDRSTVSMAEYFAMAIQAAPNCITVGEQTSGAVMNRNEIILKDNTKIDYTSVGAFYTDDTNAQRQGLKIDYKVKESAKNFNIYGYVDKAIKIIQDN